MLKVTAAPAGGAPSADSSPSSSPPLSPRAAGAAAEPAEDACYAAVACWDLGVKVAGLAFRPVAWYAGVVSLGLASNTAPGSHSTEQGQMG